MYYDERPGHDEAGDAPRGDALNVHVTPNGTMLYMPPDLEGSEFGVAQFLACQQKRWIDIAVQSERVAKLRGALRFQPLPDWMRAPPCPMPFGTTGEISGTFEQAFVRTRVRDELTRSAIDAYVRAAVWKHHPYVEDMKQFAVSITHNMAPGVLFSVGPIAYRRFGAVQESARKMYFSSPSAYAKWVAENYGT